MTEFLVFVERLMNKCRLSCDQRIPFHLHSTRFVIGQVGNTVFMTFCAFARVRQPKKNYNIETLDNKSRQICVLRGQAKRHESCR